MFYFKIIIPISAVLNTASKEAGSVIMCLLWKKKYYYYWKYLYLCDNLIKASQFSSHSWALWDYTVFRAASVTCHVSTNTIISSCLLWGQCTWKPVQPALSPSIPDTVNQVCESTSTTLPVKPTPSLLMAEKRHWPKAGWKRIFLPCQHHWLKVPENGKGLVWYVFTAERGRTSIMQKNAPCSSHGTHAVTCMHFWAT